MSTSAEHIALVNSLITIFYLLLFSLSFANRHSALVVLFCPFDHSIPDCHRQVSSIEFSFWLFHGSNDMIAAKHEPIKLQSTLRFIKACRNIYYEIIKSMGPFTGKPVRWRQRYRRCRATVNGRCEVTSMTWHRALHRFIIYMANGRVKSIAMASVVGAHRNNIVASKLNELIDHKA